MSDCAHENTETRNMSHCNQIKLQCLDCGQSVGNAIKHASIDPETLATIQEFDYEFRDLMNERRIEESRKAIVARRIEFEIQRPERKADYAEYLKSNEWRQKRAQVIDRENGICQGCRQKRIQEIHHTTYENVRDELLFQLVGLCSDCHSKCHHK